MSDLDGPHLYFALILLSFVAGATAIAALVVGRLRIQIFLALLFSLIGASLFDASDPKYTFLGIWGGNLIGLVGLTVLALFLSRWLISRYQAQSNGMRSILVPHLWDQADATPSTVAEHSKRWFVTVAAAAGSVVGVVMTDAKVGDAIRTAFSSTQIFYTIFLTVVSITLIGPGEEMVMGLSRGAADGDEGEESSSPIEQLIQRFSLGSAGRFVLVAAAWLFLNIVHKCMDETLSAGQLQASTEILFACIPIGIVTYYWCAALQRGVPSVAATSARASALATGLLIFPYATGAFMDALYQTLMLIVTRDVDQKLATGHSTLEPYLHNPMMGWFIIFLLGVCLLLAAIFAFIFSGALYGVIAYLGGRVLDIDKKRPGRASALTIVRLVPPLILWNGFLAWLAFKWVDTRHIQGWHWDHTSFYFLLGDVVWGFGLLVSGFPRIVEHARARSSGHPAQAHGSAKTA